MKEPAPARGQDNKFKAAAPACASYTDTKNAGWVTPTNHLCVRASDMQRDHKELLNKTHTAARCSGTGSSSDCKAGNSSSPSPSSDTGFHPPGSNSSNGSPPTAAGDLLAAAAPAHPAAALHKMHNNLQASP